MALMLSSMWLPLLADTNLDAVKLNFRPESLTALNVILALVMFGVALDLKLKDFKRVAQSPMSPFVGLCAQFLFLPLVTIVLVNLLQPSPSLALGMILVSACPGGNLSNFLVHFSRGRTVLSISLTAVASACAIFMTPLNVQFWTQFYAPANELLTTVNLSFLDMLQTVILILAIPLCAGLAVSELRENWAEKLRGPFRYFSLIAFASFIIIAFAKNTDLFTAHIGKIFWLVLAQNAFALATGYIVATLSRLEEDERRAIAIEVGIQNSGLGLILIFQFFDGLGGMALIAAWYGIWHIIAGLTLASYWRYKGLSTELSEQEVVENSL